MSLYIDKKYASLLSTRLDRFKWNSDGTAMFRCPICGDSKKSKTKCRGGFYVYKDSLMVGCFNCNHEFKHFGTFLKHLDHVLHKEYMYEAFKYNNDHKWFHNRAEKQEKKVEQIAKVSVNNPLQHLKSIEELGPFHPAYQYVKNRKIPTEFYNKLYYTDNYKKWINDYVEPNKFKYASSLDQRIVIPFFSGTGVPFAYQGRFIGPEDSNTERYISINPVKSNILLYGVERLKNDEPIHVVEGPIDSLFLKNGVAVAGSALTKLLKYKKLNLIFCFDQEPHSKEICSLMEKVIDANKKIVIWDNKYEFKDINDLAIFGLSATEIMQYIEKRTFQGLSAKLEFNKWRKI